MNQLLDQRINELEVRLAAYILESQRQIAAYTGAIQELRRLRDDLPQPQPSPAQGLAPANQNGGSDNG